MSKNKFDDITGTDLTIKFTSEEALLHFKAWLCERGEQDYLESVAISQENEELDDITVGFDYWSAGNTITSKSKSSYEDYNDDVGGVNGWIRAYRYSCEWIIEVYGD